MTSCSDAGRRLRQHPRARHLRRYFGQRRCLPSPRAGQRHIPVGPEQAVEPGGRYGKRGAGPLPRQISVQIHIFDRAQDTGHKAQVAKGAAVSVQACFGVRPAFDIFHDRGRQAAMRPRPQVFDRQGTGQVSARVVVARDCGLHSSASAIAISTPSTLTLSRASTRGSVQP